MAVAADKYRIITPVLRTEYGTAERAQAIRDLAAQPAHQIGGTWMPVAERTLYDWLRAAEGDVSGLLPAPRSDCGQARVLMTRLWDGTMDLPDDTKAEVAARIAREARSMAANDGTSDREIIHLCSLRLAKYSISAGSRLPAAKLKGICKLNTKWAARLDLGRFLMVHSRIAPLAAAVKVWKGGILMRNAAGLVTGGATATGCVGIGRTETTVDNSARAAGAASVAYRWRAGSGNSGRMMRASGAVSNGRRPPAR
ncbi:MAG: hypothetical protein LBE86_08450 [Gemmobacter sp.]|nr:hypothetical protein [Gemmobacter sp.]